MKKITLTIGIPAFNEEQNIESFLRSLFEQKLNKVKLEQILVYSDCSSDQTNHIVKALAKEFHQIKLIEGNSRKGKYFRVNQLFKLNKSDVEIILDADIALGGETFLEKLATELMADKKAVMMAAHVELIRPQGILKKIYHTSFVLHDFMRMNLEDCAPNFHGAATAYKYVYTSTTTIPNGLSDPHLYIYLAAKKIGNFRYCYDTKILQYPPSTLTDIKKVLNRPIGKPDSKLEAIFGTQMIHDSHILPFSAKIKGLMKSFYKYPLYTPLAIIFVMYVNRYAANLKASKSPVWDITKSTKKSITYAK